MGIRHQSIQPVYQHRTGCKSNDLFPRPFMKHWWWTSRTTKPGITWPLATRNWSKCKWLPSSFRWIKLISTRMNSDKAHKVFLEAIKCNFDNWKVWENFLWVRRGEQRTHHRYSSPLLDQCWLWWDRRHDSSVSSSTRFENQIHR